MTTVARYLAKLLQSPRLSNKRRKRLLKKLQEATK